MLMVNEVPHFTEWENNMKEVYQNAFFFFLQTVFLLLRFAVLECLNASPAGVAMNRR